MTGKTGGMGDLRKALQKWLRRNKSEQTPRKPDDKRDRKERNWYSRKGWDGAQKEKEKEKVKPNCIFCEKDHCMGRRMRCFRHAYKTQGIFHEKCVSTAVAQVIERERENAEVEAVSNARPDTTQACVINTTQCSLDTSRRLKRNHCQPSYH